MRDLRVDVERETKVSGGYFYGAEGTPFVDAANAWFWTMDCLEARESGSRGCSGLRIGRPCDPDDVVIALRRLDLPAPHAKTLVAWGKKREAPPAGSEARRFWDQAMARLSRALEAKGIVQMTRETRDLALLEAIERIAGDEEPCRPPEPFAADYRTIVGTGGMRARIGKAAIGLGRAGV